MGFREGAFASVWSAEPTRSGNGTRVRLSTSYKNKQTGQYEQDFSGYCTFYGDAHKKAANLRERDRIKLLSCDVSNSYNKDTKVSNTYFKVFDFDMADGSQPSTGSSTAAKTQTRKTAFDEGEGFEFDEDDVPF